VSVTTGLIPSLLTHTSNTHVVPFHFTVNPPKAIVLWVITLTQGNNPVYYHFSNNCHETLKAYKNLLFFKTFNALSSKLSLRIPTFWSKLTLILLMWRKWWAPNNASKWQMRFNSAFKGLICQKIHNLQS
jgi:hypothetical protein